MFLPKQSRALFAATIIATNVALSQPAFWQPVDGIRGQFVGVITVDPTGQVFVAADSGLFRSSNCGETWVSAQAGLPRFEFHETSVVTALAATRDGLFAGTLEDGVFRSIDSGANWFPTSLTNQRIHTLSANSLGHIFAGCSTTGLMRSTDAGNTWNTVLTIGIPVALCFNSYGHIFVGTMDNTDLFGMLFRSIDNGDTWTQTSLSFLVVQSLAINSKGYVFAGTLQPVLPPREDMSGIYSSTDNGENWVLLQPDSTLTRPFIAVALANNAHDHIYAGGEGIYRSFDNGKTWEQINSGLSSLKVSALAFDSAGYLFAGTSGGGLFRSQAPTTSVQRRTGANPNSFELDQSYPNPFSPNGRIETQIVFFVLPNAQQQRVMIKIFDLTGRLVRVLFDREVAPGRYEVIWDGRDAHNNVLASGTYVYRLESDKNVITKKMLLIH